jgi:hypothetical protein
MAQAYLKNQDRNSAFELCKCSKIHKQPWTNNMYQISNNVTVVHNELEDGVLPYQISIQKNKNCKPTLIVTEAKEYEITDMFKWIFNYLNNFLSSQK